MKKNKLLMGLSLTILIGLLGGGMVAEVSAKSNAKKKEHVVDTVKTQNKRQNMQHSARKAAARRLKVDYQAARVVEIAQNVNKHGHKRSSK